MNGFKRELYNVEKDWTQADDLAAKMPEKLRDMPAAVHHGGGEIPSVPARPCQVHLAKAELRARPDAVHLFGRDFQRALPVTGGAPSLLNAPTRSQPRSRFRKTAPKGLPHIERRGSVRSRKRVTIATFLLRCICRLLALN
jgi:hypothetical protein